MMGYKRRVMLPVEVFPTGYCMNCSDPHHPDRVCGMLEQHVLADRVAIEPCVCENSVSSGEPGRYVVRVTMWQKE